MNSDDAKTNKGIQANTVNANVLAVGDNAAATQNVSIGDANELSDAIDHLCRVLESVNEESPDVSDARLLANQLLEDARQESVNSKAVSARFKGLWRTVKQISETLSDSSELIAAAKKVAAVLGLIL